jgi:cell division protein FtsN
MKRLLLVLCAGLLLNVHVFAQWDDDEEDDDYGYEDDANITVTSTPNVINDGTEGYSEQKLTLPNSQPIYLYFYNTVQNPAAPETKSPPPAQTVQPAAPPPFEPDPIIEYRYVPSPVAPAPEPIYIPAPQIEYIYIQPPPPQVEYIYLPPPQVEPIYLPPPQVEPIYLPPPQVEPIVQQYIPPPPTQIRVIPALPNPDSSKIYRLQVGSYAVHNTAEKMAQRIRSAGLQAGIENYNLLKRVVVPGVRAADAWSIVQMLELLGFKEVWIRE